MVTLPICLPQDTIMSIKYQLTSTSTFDKWFSNLRARTTKTRILARLNRIENGNFGNCKQLNNSLFELKFTLGRGIRIYYTIQHNQIVLLLAGGNKSAQSKDIQRAYQLLIKHEKEGPNEY